MSQHFLGPVPQGQMVGPQSHPCLEIIVLYQLHGSHLDAPTANGPSIEDGSTLMGAPCVGFVLTYSRMLPFPELTIQYL